MAKLKILYTLMLAFIQMSLSASINHDQPASSPSSTKNGLFAADLLAKITKTTATENVIISPLSIQIALAMVYLGAAGKTAEELKKSLRLTSSDKDQVGEHFAQILKKKYGEASVIIADRLFVRSDLQLQTDFNKKTEKYFNAGAESLNFKDLPSEAIKTINTWVANETNHKITDLMKPGSIDSNTMAIIVNAIYFKGKWDTPFDKKLTQKKPFWISKTESVDVDTMSGNHGYLKYAEFSELDATAIEVPYKDSDLSMMIILPSQRDGLPNLDNKLGTVSINELSSKMKMKKINLTLPKFKINYSTGLKEVLMEMGIHSMFEGADLPGIIQSNPNVIVSDVQHEAFIDVNENGSEAAAATAVAMDGTSMGDISMDYQVDHPFFFAIKDSNTVYFSGHVVKC